MSDNLPLNAVAQPIQGTSASTSRNPSGVPLFRTCLINRAPAVRQFTLEIEHVIARPWKRLVSYSLGGGRGLNSGKELVWLRGPYGVWLMAEKFIKQATRTAVRALRLAAGDLCCIAQRATSVLVWCTSKPSLPTGDPG